MNKHLPQKSRTTLAQLRSGHCAQLRDFQLRLGKINDETCPDCELFPQNVKHLFECPAKPTMLSVTDLWDNPVEVVDHLRSSPSFNHLPQIVSPPRRHQRPRPPAAPPDSPFFTPISLPPSPPLSPVFTPLSLPSQPPRPLNLMSLFIRRPFSSTSSSSSQRGVNSP